MRALVEERLELGLAGVARPSGQGGAVRAVLAAALEAILRGSDVGGEGGLGVGRRDEGGGGGGGRR